MLRQARERLPDCAFVEGDLATWTPDEPVDLVFANAAYQWVPDHPNAMCKVVEALGTGSVLAVQMPDNTREPSHLAMEDVALRFGVAEGARQDLPPVDAYYDVLRPLCSRLDIWHTIYDHRMADAAAIAEWFRGSALRPFLARLDAQRAQEFVDLYTNELKPHYSVPTVRCSCGFQDCSSWLRGRGPYEILGTPGRRRHGPGVEGPRHAPGPHLGTLRRWG